jgi:hypothetical protein
MHTHATNWDVLLQNEMIKKFVILKSHGLILIKITNKLSSNLWAQVISIVSQILLYVLVTCAFFPNSSRQHIFHIPPRMGPKIQSVLFYSKDIYRIFIPTETFG